LVTQVFYGSAASFSGGRVEFAGFEFGEIRCRSALEAVFAVDGGVDLVIRKNEPIVGRDVFQAFHFTKLQESGCFLYGGFALGFAGRLKGLKQGEVLLHCAAQALFVKGEELELLRLLREDMSCGECCVDLGNVGAGLTSLLELAEGEEIVLDGAHTIQTPAVGCDALGELDLHGSFGPEVLHESFRKCVVGGAVFVSHGRDLAGETVT
jgi:hypothetical protein